MKRSFKLMAMLLVFVFAFSALAGCAPQAPRPG